MTFRRPAELTRSRPPEAVHPFETHLVVPHLMDVPSGCWCTWVLRPDGFSLPRVVRGTPPDSRQPWLTAGLALKFANTACPALHSTV